MSFDAASVLVVVVSCNHCPHVLAYEEERMVAIAREYAARGVAFVAVHANDPSRDPADAMAHDRAGEGAPPRFPYVRDDSPGFVRALGARFTPRPSSSTGRASFATTAASTTMSANRARCGSTI